MIAFLCLSRHGTRCAGEVAAVANNSHCIVGIAYNARIGGMHLSVCLLPCSSYFLINLRCCFGYRPATADTQHTHGLAKLTSCRKWLNPDQATGFRRSQSR